MKRGLPGDGNAERPWSHSGRTRALEAVPALAEALDSRSEETRIAAVRGLGRTGLVEAAIPLLERLVAEQLRVPEHTVKNALVNCCRTGSAILIRHLHHSTGKPRELLARVVGELAGPELVDEVPILATDPLPDVRAAAARALAHAEPSFALPVLRELARDTEWFVRLRAAVSLGSLDDPGCIRPLLRMLCDRNRYVRRRAAWALTRMEPHLADILEKVIETNDQYALEAFISELERSGGMDTLVRALEQKSGGEAAEVLLLQALTVGKQRPATAAAGSGSAAGAR